MAKAEWKPADTKALIVTVIGGVISTVAAVYILDRMGKK